MAAKKTTAKKTTRRKTSKPTARSLVVSIFTGGEVWKWRCKVGGIELECTDKTYTSSEKAITAGAKWIKDNIK